MSSFTKKRERTLYNHPGGVYIDKTKTLNKKGEKIIKRKTL